MILLVKKIATHKSTVTVLEPTQLVDSTAAKTCNSYHLLYYTCIHYTSQPDKVGINWKLDSPVASVTAVPRLAIAT